MRDPNIRYVAALKRQLYLTRAEGIVVLAVCGCLALALISGLLAYQPHDAAPVVIAVPHPGP